jgi:small subunit ribosomal protein S2
MQDITLPEMLRAGLHFGHQSSRWHPKMAPSIFSTRAGISIIDLEKTKEQLERARGFLSSVAERRGIVLFVGTKRQASDLVLAAAQRAGMPSVTKRWVGGTLTNFKTIHALLTKLEKLKEQRGSGDLGKYTKKEQLEFAEEIERLTTLVGGLTGLEKLPDALLVVDVKQERTAIREATRMHVPVVALVDTNSSPEGIEYPIPGNDDATRAVTYVLDRLVEGIESGKARAPELTAPEAAPALTAEAAPTAEAETLVPPPPTEAVIEADPVAAVVEEKVERQVEKEVEKEVAG